MTTTTDPATQGDVLPLPSPAQCRAQQSLTRADINRVTTCRDQIADILHGRDKRLLAIVGPCSVHSVTQALDYADALAGVSQRFDDALLIAMRVYIEKPRTTVGWRGLALDPALDGSLGPAEGLIESRRVMRGVIERGLPVATESLDPFVFPYVEDLLAFSSLGARTSESQTHRQMAAAMACPVGIKNATCGSLGVAADAAKAIGTSQTTFNVMPNGQVGYRTVAGNTNTALVLRGGACGPNYSQSHQEDARQLLKQRGINTGLIVDCSHGNSEKVAARQKAVVDCVSAQLVAGERPPAGVMIESHLHEGKQPFGPLPSLRYGVSVTDECLGLPDTISCLEILAGAVRSSRQQQNAALAIV